MSCCPTPNQYLPVTITAGLKFTTRLELAAYPATEWALALHLRGPKSINLEATAEGTAHVFGVLATETAMWVAGGYWYTLRTTRDGDVVEVERGQVQVLEDLVAAGDGFDGRSKAQIALDAINAVLDKRATLDQERYRINNRELYRTPIDELLKLRSFYLRQVARQNACTTGSRRFGRNVPVRFS